MFIPLLALVVKSVGDFVSNDSSDGCKVKIPWHVGIEEDTLEDACWELHVVLSRIIEGIDHCDKAVFNPRLGIDLFAKAAVVEGSPELDQIKGISKVVIGRPSTFS